MVPVSTDVRLCFPGDCTALGAQGRRQLSSPSHTFLCHLTLCASLPKPSSQALVARLAAGFSRISGCSALGSLVYVTCIWIVDTQYRQYTGTTHSGTLHPFTMGSPNLKATNPIPTCLNIQRPEFQMISQTYPLIPINAPHPLTPTPATKHGQVLTILIPPTAVVTGCQGLLFCTTALCLDLELRAGICHPFFLYSPQLTGES